MTQSAGSPPSARAAERLPRGHRIAGRYVIESVIGEGATSVVYQARIEPSSGAPRASPVAREIGDDSQPMSLRLVALKVLHRALCDDAQIVGRFRREAAILSRLVGPHVLRVHETLEDRGSLVLVLEYVAGVPLDRRLAEVKPLKAAAAIEIALQVCAGLGSAHAAGVVHRDLKPANVLHSADETGGRVLVKVADFGLAKLVHGEKMVTGLTEHDMIFGTPEYMAPEQARGDEVDGRADIYALGCILYEMLTGEVPFRETSPVATMAAHVTREVVPPRKRRPEAALSPALEAVVMRALAKSPEDRYPSARAFAEALTAAVDGLRVVAATSPAGADAGDTDLNVAETAPPAAPSQRPAPPTGVSLTPSVGARTNPGVEDVKPKKAPSPVARKSAWGEVAPASRSDGGPSWPWIAVAVIAALIAIGVGIALGVR